MKHLAPKPKFISKLKQVLADNIQTMNWLTFRQESVPWIFLMVTLTKASSIKQSF